MVFKFQGGQQKLCISVEIFVDWLANKNPPWTAYRVFVSGRLIALYKQPGVSPVRFRETFIPLFTKFILKVAVPKATNVWQDDHI